MSRRVKIECGDRASAGRLTGRRPPNLCAGIGGLPTRFGRLLAASPGLFDAEQSLIWAGSCGSRTAVPGAPRVNFSSKIAMDSRQLRWGRNNGHSNVKQLSTIWPVESRRCANEGNRQSRRSQCSGSSRTPSNHSGCTSCVSTLHKISYGCLQCLYMGRFQRSLLVGSAENAGGGRECIGSHQQVFHRRISS
jgi:hypothetical protein